MPTKPIIKNDELKMRLSIDSVCQAFKEFVSKKLIFSAPTRIKKHSHKGKNKAHVDDLISAIELVKKSYEDFKARKESQKDKARNLIITSYIKSIESVCEGQRKSTPRLSLPVDNNSKNRISILECIGQEFKENLHSDFIASFFSSRKFGLLAIQHLIEKLLKLSESDADQFSVSDITYVAVEREKKIEDVYCKYMKNGDRRMDLFVTIYLRGKSTAYMCIENKVHSNESDKQTQDYWDSMAKRNGSKFGILLAPNKIQPKCPEFRNITYRQLFDIIKELLIKNLVSDNIAKELCHQYLFELSKTILSKECNN
jgi:hypothetical protein